MAFYSLYPCEECSPLAVHSIFFLQALKRYILVFFKNYHGRTTKHACTTAYVHVKHCKCTTTTRAPLLRATVHHCHCAPLPLCTTATRAPLPHVRHCHCAPLPLCTTATMHHCHCAPLPHVHRCHTCTTATRAPLPLCTTATVHHCHTCHVHYSHTCTTATVHHCHCHCAPLPHVRHCHSAPLLRATCHMHHCHTCTTATRAPLPLCTTATCNVHHCHTCATATVHHCYVPRAPLPHVYHCPRSNAPPSYYAHPQTQIARAATDPPYFTYAHNCIHAAWVAAAISLFHPHLYLHTGCLTATAFSLLINQTKLYLFYSRLHLHADCSCCHCPWSSSCT